MEHDFVSVYGGDNRTAYYKISGFDMDHNDNCLSDIFCNAGSSCSFFWKWHMDASGSGVFRLHFECNGSVFFKLCNEKEQI